MTKREAKNLAREFAKLRPLKEPDGSPLDTLWREMVGATAEHLSSKLANAFTACCLTHGLWMKEYEG